MKKKLLAYVLLILTLISYIGPGYAKEDAPPSGLTYEELGPSIEAFVQDHKDQTAGLALSVFDSQGVIVDFL